MSELNKKIKALPDGCDLYAGDLDNPPVVDLGFGISDLKALVLENEKLQNEVELLRKGVDHYADSQNWAICDDSEGLDGLYDPLSGIRNGYDFARQIQAQVNGEEND